jgi:hypothetical protein
MVVGVGSVVGVTEVAGIVLEVVVSGAEVGDACEVEAVAGSPDVVGAAVPPQAASTTIMIRRPLRTMVQRNPEWRGFPLVTPLKVFTPSATQEEPSLALLFVRLWALGAEAVRPRDP